MGVIQLHRVYGSERLNKAFERALYGDYYQYNRVKNILVNKLHQEPIDTEVLENEITHIPIHENIRGAAAYQ